MKTQCRRQHSSYLIRASLIRRTPNPQDPSCKYGCLLLSTLSPTVHLVNPPCISVPQNKNREELLRLHLFQGLIKSKHGYKCEIMLLNHIMQLTQLILLNWLLHVLFNKCGSQIIRKCKDFQTYSVCSTFKDCCDNQSTSSSSAGQSCSCSSSVRFLCI